jgi:hypothetical protein
MRFVVAVILTLLSGHSLLSQPEYHSPCAQIDTFHSLCQFACTLCDIDDFSKWTEDDVWQGSGGVTIPVSECGPSGGGGRDIFSFIAMSSELTLRVTVPECMHEDGPQAIERDFSVEGFYSANNRCFDGNNLSLNYNFISIFSCRDEDFIIQAGQSKLFTSTIPLIVGGVYYLQLGTSGSTECLYEIEVVEGSTEIPTLNPPGLNNTGPVCVGETVRYESQDTVPITQYAITLNGDTITREYATNITWTESGVYELCLHQRNPCDVQLPECYEIIVLDLPPVDTTVYLCPSTCQTVFDSTLCESGIYIYDYINMNGCRASASVEVVNYRNDTTLLFAQVCQGDTLFYQERSFFTTGRYDWLSSNIHGCDSLVYLDVEVAFCPLEIESTYQDILCYGDTDGQITVSIQSGLSPFDYTFRQLVVCQA